MRATAAEVARNHADANVITNSPALQYDRALSDPELEPERIEDQVAINSLAPALLIHGFLPILLCQQRTAAIVNVNTDLAIFPERRTALYCATKAGLHSLSWHLHYQPVHTNVAVLEAFLPLVDTGRTARWGSGKINAEAAADDILGGIAAGRQQTWIGKARLVPIFARVSPSIARAGLK